MTKTSLADLREEMRSVARGDRGAAPLPAGPMLACLTRDSLDMLAVLLRQRPATVSELATLTGRAQPNVSRSLQALAGVGLVRLVREGREVRPRQMIRALTVDLATGTFETIPASA